MSAIVCGKRSIFEELSAAPSKRIRCSSTSPVRFSPPPASQSALLLLDHLFSIFPDMDKELLERALAECGDDLDSAIRSLNELRLGSSRSDLGAADSRTNVEPEANVQVLTQGDVSAQENVPVNGAEWVELFVGEMMSAANVDDAKARASRALEVLEKSISSRARAEASQSFLQENSILKQQVEALVQENALLKRAVSIQHERQKEYDDRSQELENLKQLLSQYQEQLRTLEVNNYALTMHLKQAEQGSSIPGRFHPDVF